jgi:uncharacterized protein (TIGR00251 family)
VVVKVHVTPRASRSAVKGIHGGRLKVTLDAPPVDGAANEALIRLFSKLLGVSKRDVRIVQGEASRQKTLMVRGVDEAAIRALVETH